MDVVVEFHRHAEAPLRDALAALARRRPNGELIARVALELIRNQLVRTAGKIPDTLTDASLDPPLQWWEFARGFWVAFLVQDRGLWRWRYRRITVYEVAERPPDRVVSSSRRS
jgi:hypothetical protein